MRIEIDNFAKIKYLYLEMENWFLSMKLVVLVKAQCIEL